MTGYESKRDMAQDKITDEQGRPMTYWGGKAQPAQKPKSFTYNEVADAMNSLRKGNSVQKAYAEEVGKLKLYAAPPQRTWVELEGEEIRNLWEEATKPDRSTVTMVTSFARAIEAKLKEKNNGT
jgi:hypothetical protein